MVNYERGGIRRRRRPASVIYWFDGYPFRVDLAAIDRALCARIVAGKYKSREHFAESFGRSRSTVSRFFSGRGAGLPVFLQILNELELKFDDVATLVTEVGQQ